MVLTCTFLIPPVGCPLNSFYWYTVPDIATPSLLLCFQSRHHYYGWLCPRGTHRYFQTCGFFRLTFSLHIVPTGSQVPPECLYKAHAAYTPDAAGTVNRSSSQLIIKCYCTLLLTSFNPFDASSAVHLHSSSLYLPDSFKLPFLLMLPTLALYQSNLAAVWYLLL